MKDSPSAVSEAVERVIQVGWPEQMARKLGEVAKAAQAYDSIILAGVVKILAGYARMNAPVPDTELVRMTGSQACCGTSTSISSRPCAACPHCWKVWKILDGQSPPSRGSQNLMSSAMQFVTWCQCALTRRLSPFTMAESI
eukprot:6352539-Amphidinium_carterae.4